MARHPHRDHADVWRGRAAKIGAKRWLASVLAVVKCALQEKSSGSVTNRLEMR